MVESQPNFLRLMFYFITKGRIYYSFHFSSHLCLCLAFRMNKFFSQKTLRQRIEIVCKLCLVPTASCQDGNNLLRLSQLKLRFLLCLLPSQFDLQKATLKEYSSTSHLLSFTVKTNAKTTIKTSISFKTQFSFPSKNDSVPIYFLCQLRRTKENNDTKPQRFMEF